MLKWKFWHKESQLDKELATLKQNGADEADLRAYRDSYVDWEAFRNAARDSLTTKDFWTPIKIPKPSFDALDSLLARILKSFDHSDKILCRFIRPDKSIVEKWIPASAKHVILGKEMYTVDLSCITAAGYNQGLYRLFPIEINTLTYKYDSANPIAPQPGNLVSSMIGTMIGMLTATAILGALGQKGEDEEIPNAPTITALTTTTLPSLDLGKIEGIVAYRSWAMAIEDVDFTDKTNPHYGANSKPLLTGTVHMTPWRHLTFADKVPDESNPHGLYAHKITLGNESLTNGGDVSGLVELKGKVVEHEDGILRAEYAKILQIWLDADTVADDWNGMASKYIQGLHDNYPTVPIYVLTEAQRTQALMWVAVSNYLRDGNAIPKGILSAEKA